MPEETNTMSYCEGITAIVALIALIQPWVIKLWNFLFRRITIAFIPSGKIKLFYNRSGAYVQIGGVVEVKNQDAVIEDISAKVVRRCDNAELKMNWSSFNVPVYQQIAGNLLTTSETARPFKIRANELSPVFVEFCDVNDSFTDHLDEIYSSLATEAKSFANPNVSLEDACQKFRSTSNYQKIKEELLESFYWKPSQYLLVITVHCGRNIQKDFSYEFSLNQAEIKEFKKDIEKAMDSLIYSLYGQIPHFYYPSKNYVECSESR